MAANLRLAVVLGELILRFCSHGIRSFIRVAGGR